MPVSKVYRVWRRTLNGWAPDDSLVEKVRLIGHPMAEVSRCSNADRVWAVVSLSALGWTAQEIADRMECSLRLIRNIKAEHAAELAAYALQLRTQLIAVSTSCQREVTTLRMQVSAQNTQIDQLRRQRSDLISQLQLAQALTPVRRAAPTPRRTSA